MYNFWQPCKMSTRKYQKIYVFCIRQNIIHSRNLYFKKHKVLTMRPDYEYEWELIESKIGGLKNRIEGLKGVDYFANVFGSMNGVDDPVKNSGLALCNYKYKNGCCVQLRLRNVRAPETLIAMLIWCVIMLIAGSKDKTGRKSRERWMLHLINVIDLYFQTDGNMVFLRYWWRLDYHCIGIWRISKVLNSEFNSNCTWLHGCFSGCFWFETWL